MDHLLTMTTIVHHLGQGAVDRHGNPVKQETGQTSYPAFLNVTETRELEIDRETVTVDGLLVLPPEAIVGSSDWVEIDGEAYDVVGSPRKARSPHTGVHHVEVDLRASSG